MRATYYLETVVSLGEAASRIANEQGAGLTDNDVRGLNGVVVRRGTAEVVSVVAVEPRGRPLSLPTSFPTSAAHRSDLKAAEVTIEFGEVVHEAGVEGLLNTVFGEPQNLGVLSALRLLDVDVDWRTFGLGGPRHGVSGLRRILRIDTRPILVAPIKPSMGLDLETHVGRGVTAARGGADIVKDDELCYSTGYNPLVPRIRRMRDELSTLSDTSGQRTLYIANLIGPRSNLSERLQQAVEAGAEAVLVAPSLMGIDVASEVRAESDVVICSHMTFTLGQTRVVNFGVEFKLFVTIQRHMGADLILLPSHGGSFGVSPSETRASVRACLDDGMSEPCLPAHSGSMSALNYRIVRELSSTDDFAFTSGAGLFDHPGGVEQGARELRQLVEFGIEPSDTSWIKQWQPGSESLR
jgi:ribulose 1,5-bisphosphate carboxylase large subunit-like protein